MQKYKLSWKDISFDDFKVYLFAMFRAFIPKKKIKNLDELEHFIQKKKLISPIIKVKLEAEAMQLNFLPKQNSLDSALFE